MRRLTAQSALLIKALALCACVVPGCASFRLPQIDPSGESLFVNPGATPQAAFRETPPTNREASRVGIVLAPRATVAPIGSEVILLAGVRGPDQYMWTNERVEWMIDPGSVGQFVDLDKGSWTDPLVCDFIRARKIDNCYAVNTTSRRFLRLTRGTPDTSDDMEVLKGQAWVTLTSAREGTSDVTVYCPGVSPWHARTETCQVHWVDAQWSFPSIAIAESGGRQLLETTVTRQSDCTPRCGWHVRYEIVGGPPAAFAPDGSQVVEIPTGPDGKASVELYQTEPQAGTSKIVIQVIRPAGLGCPNQKVVVGKTCLSQTWSAPSLGVRVQGPTAGSIGSNNAFRIDVSNPGDMAADTVTLTVPVPPGLSYVGASPTSEGTGSTLRWTIGRLAPGEVRSIALDLRSDQSGQYELCADAVAASGLSARSCASLAVEAAEIAVEVSGPVEATVGEFVTHRIVITNRGRVPATGLVLTDVRDAGLEHNLPQLQIERALGNLGPMQSQEVTITFRAAQAGRQCHTVQVTGAGSLRDRSEKCIEVREAPAVQPTQPSPQPSPTEPTWNQPEPPAAPPATPPVTQPVAPPVVSSLPTFEIATAFALDPDSQIPVQSAKEGEMVVLMLDVSSPEGQALADLKLEITMDEVFKPLRATDGYTRVGNAFIWEGFGVDAGMLVGRVALLCRCEASSPRACFYATVSDAGGQVLKREGCIPISAAESSDAMEPSPPAVAPTGQLEVTITTAHKPVRQNKSFTYLIQVVNRAPTTDTDVLVRVAFPPELKPRYWRTRGPTPFVISDNTVLFKEFASMVAGYNLEYTVYVEAGEASDEELVVRAEAKSTNQPEPTSAEDTIRISAL